MLGVCTRACKKTTKQQYCHQVNFYIKISTNRLSGEGKKKKSEKKRGKKYTAQIPVPVIILTKELISELNKSLEKESIFKWN